MLTIITRAGLPEKYDKRLKHFFGFPITDDKNYRRLWVTRWQTEEVVIQDWLVGFPDGTGILATRIMRHETNESTLAIVAFGDFDELFAMHEEEFCPKVELSASLNNQEVAIALGLKSANTVRLYWKRGLIERAPVKQWTYAGRPLYTRESIEEYLKNKK
jgi:hypothetical protein